MALDGLRNWANENAGLAGIIFVVIIIGVGAWLWSTMGGGPRDVAGDAWFYDPVTKTYFGGSALEYSPITSRDGNPSYRAWFWDCGECSDATEPETEPAGFIGYYENYSPEGAAKLNALRQTVDDARGSSDPATAAAAQNAQSEMMTITMNKLVSRDAVNWEPAETSRGLPTFFEDEIRERCRDKGDLKNCTPDNS